MRYSSAVLLSTLAVGQAAAAHVHNRHASFHERRQAEVKRDDTAINWDAISYDLKNVDWNAVNWKSVFAQPAAQTAAPVPVSASPAQASPQVQAAAAPAAVTSVPANPATAYVQSTSNTNTGNAVSDIMQGVQTLANKLGIKTGQNDKSSNGAIWIGTDGDWQAEFHNSASQDVVLYCWTKDGYTGMFVQKYAPLISVGIKAGQHIGLSFAPNVGAACTPVYPDTILQPDYGYIFQTLFEVTFAPNYGAFDISRETNMNGRSISAQGSKCLSDMNTCVYKCTGNVDSCTTGYELYGCSASNGGGSGYNPVMKGTGGGCSMGANNEKIVVTLS